MKVCTDACLFGGWVARDPMVISAGSILDIGTGTGVLSLMLAQQFPTAQITALEIEESAAMQAAENFANAKWSSNIKCQQVNLRCVVLEFSEKEVEIHRQLSIILFL